ncbi:MAG: DUF4065 domain-containing protein [Sutterella wadsworthensis]|nr:DUF4065 domain-containing protein [Sutterella wadsworthensis]
MSTLTASKDERNTSFQILDSVALVAYIIDRSKSLGVKGLNPTKIQKLTYCCYGMVLAYNGLRLCDENPEAWQYGPVFPSTLRLMQRLGGVDDFAMAIPAPKQNQFPKDVAELIDQTLITFGKFTATQLSMWSHRSGSPWDVASIGGKVYFEQIKDTLITDYFKRYVVRHEPLPV